MDLHNPLQRVNHVVNSYRNYVLGEFRPRDHQLRAALEHALARPGLLAQEPYYELRGTAQPGAHWRDLFLDERLALALEEQTNSPHAYTHQATAITHLLRPEPTPLLLASGTGTGKGEAFIVPVLQRAIEDAVRFAKPGISAVLLYPLRALAQDQEQRINQLLRISGWSGAVKVATYDRATTQAKREALRRTPPHILVTNYAMLEYLLIRPADRDALFANHRCRFLILDEIHSYRGLLGSNVAHLVRRLRAHLIGATQDWCTDVPAAVQSLRFPTLITVGASASIRAFGQTSSGSQAELAEVDITRQFFGALCDVNPDTVRVVTAEASLPAPPDNASYPTTRIDLSKVNFADPDSVRRAVCLLADQPEDTPLEQATERCKILWDIRHELAKGPLTLAQLSARLAGPLMAERNILRPAAKREIAAALALGTTLPGKLSTALALRAHLFLRGSWEFRRCLNSACGNVYAEGETTCFCGCLTAPLFLCRSCGADYTALAGDPDRELLAPGTSLDGESSWILYEPSRFTPHAPDHDSSSDQDDMPRLHQRLPRRLKGRGLKVGFFNPRTRVFSTEANEQSTAVVLSPARTRCLACGHTAGSNNILTPVALGTSAAVKEIADVIVEMTSHGQNGKKPRLLIFSDSRQDAAHQARYIATASRYDRMRQRVMQVLQKHGRVSYQRLVEHLGALAVEVGDNPHLPQDCSWIDPASLQRIRTWEEMPLLDNLAIAASFRGSLSNLGLVGVSYRGLKRYIAQEGIGVAATLGITTGQLLYICVCLLDEIRSHGCFSRDVLRYHPAHALRPEFFSAAMWERRLKQARGYAAVDGKPALWIDTATVSDGIAVNNWWRRPGIGGRPPSPQRIFEHLLRRFDGVSSAEHLLEVLALLQHGRFLIASELFGVRHSSTLIQVNADTVELFPVSEATSLRCDRCRAPLSSSDSDVVCPFCDGLPIVWSDAEVLSNRLAQRALKPSSHLLYPAEHTAQVPNKLRQNLEQEFREPGKGSFVNVLCCSPTLELGIDIGGLDAVLLRNTPPSPDAYTQRAGRAARRGAFGLTVTFARNVPHDQYFFDRPEEMIAGAMPPPIFSLLNREVLTRHLNAVAVGCTTPGLASRMSNYVTPSGVINEEAVEEFREGLRRTTGKALATIRQAWNEQLLIEIGLDDNALRAELERLPERFLAVVERVARQVTELRRPLDAYVSHLRHARAGTRAGELVAQLLGIPSDGNPGRGQEDYTIGYPLRQLAEHGILPGYEFPQEMATVRLLGDAHEAEPVLTAHRLGITQFQPEAVLFARQARWRVAGLDMSSHLNPRHTEASWHYKSCDRCMLRFDATAARCPRCGANAGQQRLPAHGFAGFVARREEQPALDETERYASGQSLIINPQWDSDSYRQWSLPGKWKARLTRETICWLNEGPLIAPETSAVPSLHAGARGFPLCPGCGQLLIFPNKGGERTRSRSKSRDQYGHAEHCSLRETPPVPVALLSRGVHEMLRLSFPIPQAISANDIAVWGLSLGYALQLGAQRHFSVESSELEFTMEGPWYEQDLITHQRVALTYIDPTVGGSGLLPKLSAELHLAARRALQHLDHAGCSSACYRCLKNYQNQRHHKLLSWPLAVPALDMLARRAPKLQANEQQANDHAWLAAYAAGVGSPLELRFLRLFEAHQFFPERQFPISERPGEPHFTIVDFALPDERVALYIDSASFHTGMNLRRDRVIRAHLRSMRPPWTVIELRASHLKLGSELVAQLQSLIRRESSAE